MCSLHYSKRRSLRSPQTPPKRPRVNGASQRALNTSTSPDVRPQSPPSAPPHNDDGDSDDTDDDIFILETASTPKPTEKVFDLTKMKEEKEKEKEGNAADMIMLMDFSDDSALDDAMETNDAGTGSAAVRTSPSLAPLPLHADITTQTEASRVKIEVESQNQTNEVESAGESVSNSSSKQQNEGVNTYVSSIERNHLVNGEVAGLSCADIATRESPVHFPNVNEAQEQQDELLKLLQATAQERDSFKEQVHKLTCELKDTQDKLQELTRVPMKMESSHQAVQTEEKEEENRYKNLFEKAKQKVDELIRDKESLLTAAETKPSTAHSQERDLDEIAVHVDSLLRELDQKNKERGEMLSRVSMFAVISLDSKVLTH